MRRCELELVPDTAWRFLNVGEAARYIGRTEKAVYRLVARRSIPFIKHGRRVHFDRLALDRWMARGAVDAAVRRVVHSPSSRESAPEARG
jgi:excisionase family DNA binding protein